jgi:hypothetical protein
MMPNTIPGPRQQERETRMPERIQRKRTGGWRLPAGAVCVTRPGRWGNPWREGSANWTVGPRGMIDRSGKTLTRQDAVDSYRHSLLNAPDLMEAVRRELGGKDLACWCPPGEPCHADVLLAIANGGDQ